MCTLPGGSLHPAWAGCKIRVPPEIRPAPCLAGHASRHSATTLWPPTWTQEGKNIFICVGINFLINFIRSECDWGRAGGRGWDGREIGRSGRLYVRRAAVRHHGDQDGAARASPRLRNIFSQFMWKNMLSQSLSACSVVASL